MKKINPSSDSCEKWKLDERLFHKAIIRKNSIIKRCGSCYYNLFGVCWLDDYMLSEASNYAILVKQALAGNEEAEQELHRLLKLGKREGGES